MNRYAYFGGRPKLSFWGATAPMTANAPDVHAGGLSLAHADGARACVDTWIAISPAQRLQGLKTAQQICVKELYIKNVSCRELAFVEKWPKPTRHHSWTITLLQTTRGSLLLPVM